jgi:hypothetical protein
MSKPPPPAPAAPREPSAKDLILAQQRLSFLRLGFLFFGASLLVACDSDDAPPSHGVGSAAHHRADRSRAEPEAPAPDDHREPMVRADGPALASAAPPAGFFSEHLADRMFEVPPGASLTSPEVALDVRNAPAP